MRNRSLLLVPALALLALQGCSRRTEITAPTPPTTAHHIEFAPDSSRRGPGTQGGGN